MAKDEASFTYLDKKFRTKMKLGNGDQVQVKGKGSVSIQTKQGTKIISYMLFVPFLLQNLLSVPQLLEKGYCVMFKNHSCTIFN